MDDPRLWRWLIIWLVTPLGSEAGLQEAKDAIMQTVEGGGRGRGRQD